jgi:hypothetical protein
MKLRSKLTALVGAGALVLGIAGTAFASTGTVDWTGQGTKDGQLNTEDCTVNNGAPYLFWVLSPSTNISAAELWINGNDVGAMDGSDGSTFKLQTDFFDLSTLQASAAITYSGDLSGGLNLKISHGCSGETSSTTSFTSSESSESTSTTSFTSSESSESTTLPNTATIGNTGSSGMSNGLWMLLAGIGVVGGSVLVLMPARAKGKR